MNNLKHIFFASMLMASMTAAAQETYQDAKLAAPQLTGTARYVGMGGAMEALGADISTISSNPAGVGLIDMPSYESYLNGDLQDYRVSDEEINKFLSTVPKVD